jgi:AcrR family transcriptional regulator
VEQPTRREQQAEQRRIQLIDTALALFADQGYDRTSIKDLAQAAGVAQGLVYHYFDSKEDLLLAVVDRHNPLPQVRALLEGIADQPASLLLPQLLHGFYGIFSEKRPLFVVGLRELLVDGRVRARIHQFQREGLTLLARYLAARVAAGELRPHNTEVSAQAVLSGGISLFIAGTPPEPFISEFVATLMRGIAV